MYIERSERLEDLGESLTSPIDEKRLSSVVVVGSVASREVVGGPRRRRGPSAGPMGRYLRLESLRRN